MRATDYAFRVASKLPVTAKQRFYDDTFLTAKDGTTILFICDAAIVEGKNGPLLRTKRDVLEFPTEKDMLSAVVAGGWNVAPLDGNSRWRPTHKQVLWRE